MTSVNPTLKTVDPLLADHTFISDHSSQAGKRSGRTLEYSFSKRSDAQNDVITSFPNEFLQPRIVDQQFFPNGKLMAGPKSNNPQIMNPHFVLVSHHRQDNLSHCERWALAELQARHDIVIKPAYKGSSVVIINTSDYITEAEKTAQWPVFSYCPAIRSHPVIQPGRERSDWRTYVQKWDFREMPCLSHQQRPKSRIAVFTQAACHAATPGVATFLQITPVGSWFCVCISAEIARRQTWGYQRRWNARWRVNKPMLAGLARQNWQTRLGLISTPYSSDQSLAV